MYVQAISDINGENYDDLFNTQTADKGAGITDI